MGIEFWFTLLLLAAMTYLLAREVMEPEVVLFGTVLLLLGARIITVGEAFAGFSNEGLITLALLFIVAGSLQVTGAVNWVNRWLFGDPRRPLSVQLLRILFPVAGVSAFMNNTPVVAMLIPAVRSWTDKHNLSPAKFLLPISYAAILGGLCTLIGTSTTLVVHGLMLEYGLEGMGLFEISRIGVPAALLGIGFLALVGHRLLPDRKEPMVALGANTREFVIELKVTPEYPQVGKTVEEAGLRHLSGLFLFQIERNGQVIAPAAPNEVIRVGDRLFFTGVPRTILELQRTPGLQLIKDSQFDLKQYDSSKIRPYEAVISPSSPLVGKNVRESNFRSTYNAVIIAIHRNGQRIQKKIGDIVLHPGDTLLLLADRDFRRRWYHSNDFYLIADSVQIPSRPRWQAYLSIGTMAGMLLVAGLGLLPLVSAAGLAALVLVGSRTLTPTEARRLLDWRVLIIIASSFGIAAAVQHVGLADLLARAMVAFGGFAGATGVLAAVYLLTSLYSSFITNKAGAVIMAPIAYLAAGAVQADPRAFLMAVAMAAGAGFATPISQQTNLMVYGPGGYRFRDFLRTGLVLQTLVGILAVGLIYFWYLR